MIEELMKENDDVRLSRGKRWLVRIGEWMVIEKIGVKVHRLYQGDELPAALKILMEE